MIGIGLQLPTLPPAPRAHPGEAEAKQGKHCGFGHVSPSVASVAPAPRGGRSSGRPPNEYQIWIRRCFDVVFRTERNVTNGCAVESSGGTTARNTVRESPGS